MGMKNERSADAVQKECQSGVSANVERTVRLAGVVYVLHAIRKKSKTGSKTPAEEMDQVRTRLKEAERDNAERKSDQVDPS